MHTLITGPASISFPVTGPLYCPYYNQWGKDVYTRSEAFADNPFKVLASSTSGSPAIVDAAGQFFHFMTDAVEQGCEFAFNPRNPRPRNLGNLNVSQEQTLTVTIPEGQQLYHDDSGDMQTAWKKCNSLIMASRPLLHPVQNRPDHWDMIEYCTWVEQKRQAGQGTPLAVLNDAFIDDYIQRVNDMGLPKGKFTIDHGWMPGHETYGDWDVDTARFPNFEQTIRRIADNGFVPGLWFAPVWLHQKSRIVAAHKHILGPAIARGTVDTALGQDPWHYWADCEDTYKLIKPVFTRYIDIGIRKFKWDMIYAEKSFMKKLHMMFYQAIKEIDPSVEVEIHQPDIFFAQYGDVIRTNDVLCNDTADWKAVTLAHFKVCQYSSPGKVINLDHIGGNDPTVTPDRFLEHLSLYKGVAGYPVVSLLPDSISDECVDALRTYLKEYEASPTPVNHFYDQDGFKQSLS